MSSTWGDADKVREYVGRIGRIEARRHGEAELIEHLPDRIDRALDLGCGDGRLLELVVRAGGTSTEGTALDVSEPMLELARQRFADHPNVTIQRHDLRNPLPDLGRFDTIVSGFAIHHLEHDRKRSLFGEVAHALTPAGRFINLEVVRCATDALQHDFNERIGRSGGDPEDILAGVDEQLGWMRDAGLVDVDCMWRWRGFALLVGRAPARQNGQSARRADSTLSSRTARSGTPPLTTTRSIVPVHGNGGE